MHGRRIGFWSVVIIIGIIVLSATILSSCDNGPGNSTDSYPEQTIQSNGPVGTEDSLSAGASTVSTTAVSKSQDTEKVEFNEPVLTFPGNGSVKNFTGKETVAPLQIVTSKEDKYYYYVKLTDYSTGKDALAIYIQPGKTVNVDVPLGSYTIKYAAGNIWYGEKYLFGPDTRYCKAMDQFDFKISGNQVSGYTIELIMQTGGNLSTEEIDAEEF